jgi:cystathionine beta-lyase/cystathionine gamma-synthase
MNDCDAPYFNSFYSRFGNPTRDPLETCIASLEGGKYGLTTSSGMSAVMLITHLLNSGDHILIAEDVYGGTYSYFEKIATTKYGMETSFIDMTDLDTLKQSIKDNTKMVWIETPSNPLLK